MFLTNNYRTINNLMVYSKGEYINKIIPKFYENIKSEYIWIKNLKINWDKFLKNKSKHYYIDFNVKPFGNLKNFVNLITNKRGKLFLENKDGKICF